MKASEMLDAVRNGKRILIKSYTRPQIIDKKCLDKWEKAGYTLLKDDGEGFRLAQGKTSVFVFASSIAVID